MCACVCTRTGNPSTFSRPGTRRRFSGGAPQKKSTTGIASPRRLQMGGSRSAMIVLLRAPSGCLRLRACVHSMRLNLFSAASLPQSKEKRKNVQPGSRTDAVAAHGSESDSVKDFLSNRNARRHGCAFPAAPRRRPQPACVPTTIAAPHVAPADRL